MKRYYLALDLKDDPKLIEEYRKHHERIWPEITASMRQAGVLDAEIYLRGTRMVMLLETTDDFSLAKKAKLDSENPKVREWEQLMWKFQQALPEAANGEKWLLMERIFKLEP